MQEQKLLYWKLKLFKKLKKQKHYISENDKNTKKKLKN